MAPFVKCCDVMTWRLQFRRINHSISSRLSKAQLSYAFDQWGDAFYEEGRVVGRVGMCKTL